MVGVGIINRTVTHSRTHPHWSINYTSVREPTKPASRDESGCSYSPGVLLSSRAFQKHVYAKWSSCMLWKHCEVSIWTIQIFHCLIIPVHDLYMAESEGDKLHTVPSNHICDISRLYMIEVLLSYRLQSRRPRTMEPVIHP
jgi:hypothetical protein